MSREEILAAFKAASRKKADAEAELETLRFQAKLFFSDEYCTANAEKVEPDELLEYALPEHRNWVEAGRYCSTSEALDFLDDIWDDSPEWFRKNVLGNEIVASNDSGRWLIDRRSVYQWRIKKEAESIDNRL